MVRESFPSSFRRPSAPSGNYTLVYTRVYVYVRARARVRMYTYEYMWNVRAKPTIVVLRRPRFVLLYPSVSLSSGPPQ